MANENARLIRELLNDVRAGRAINTSGNVQGALEAGAAALDAEADHTNQAARAAGDPLHAGAPGTAGAAPGTPPNVVQSPTSGAPPAQPHGLTGEHDGPVMSPTAHSSPSGHSAGHSNPRK